MTNIDSSLIKNMLDNAVHIGHKKQYWSPKMKSYIFGEQNGIHVFDLYKTAAKLEEVKQTLKEFAEKGKDIIFVGTKIQAQKLVKEFANETGNFYVMNKWVPGLLTNYSTIKKRIIAYTKLEKDLETGALNILNKKEKSQKMKELEKFKKAYEGVKELKKTPDAIFVIDGHYENLALEESKKLKIPSYALLGSTGDIDSCTDFIPCNVNSIKAIKFILDYLKPALTKKKIMRTFDTEKSFLPKKKEDNTKEIKATKSTEVEIEE